MPHLIGIYDDDFDPNACPADADDMSVGDGIYYDGGVYGPDGGPDPVDEDS
ncbi:hypothetical protein ACIRLA_22000 [Streptomyces sp. NPDC102364]|uniref:hypothetical protein n=1 Tax=Streptomyces sp. NPDC102364 TaxID=3366161 RepID=UPI0037FC156A